MRLDGVLRVIGEARRRRWLQRVVRRGVRATTVLCGLAVGPILLVRGAWLDAQRDPLLLGAAALACVAAFAWLVGHRLPWFHAARLLDREAGGADRLSTSLALVAEERDDAWARVQARDARRWAATLDVHALLPWRSPGGLGSLSVAVALAILATFLPIDWLQAGVGASPLWSVSVELPLMAPPIVSAATVLDADERVLIARDARLLRDVEAQLEPGPARTRVREVRELLEDVVRGRIDKRDALARLADLGEAPSVPPDTGHPQAPESDPPHAAAHPSGASSKATASFSSAGDRAVRTAMSRALKESLKSAPQGEARRALEKAAEKEDLGDIARWVEKMARKNWTDRELEKWIKVAERFAGKLGDRKIPKRFESLRKRIERLRRKRNRQGGLGQGDRRRLRSTRRQLQQLRRRHGDVEAARYRLQRLTRQARQAAEQLRRQRRRARLTPRRAKRAREELRRQRRQLFRRQMRGASQELRRMSQQQKARHAERISRGRAQAARKALSRTARRSGSREDFERRARRRSARGKQGDGQTPRTRQSQAAGRQASQRRTSGRSKAGQGRGQVQLGRGRMDGRTRMPMLRAGARQPSGAGDENDTPGGNEAGVGQGKRPLGEATRRGQRAARTERVRGLHGQGPSVKQVFLDAARKGFARTSWRRVYADYSEVAEEMLDKEGLPPGRKALVRRYFENIRPADSGAARHREER